MNTLGKRHHVISRTFQLVHNILTKCLSHSMNSETRLRANGLPSQAKRMMDLVITVAMLLHAGAYPTRAKGYAWNGSYRGCVGQEFKEIWSERRFDRSHNRFHTPGLSFPPPAAGSYRLRLRLYADDGLRGWTHLPLWCMTPSSVVITPSNEVWFKVRSISRLINNHTSAPYWTVLIWILTIIILLMIIPSPLQRNTYLCHHQF